MKIEDAKYTGFKPFKVVLTIESMSELVLLWMRLNASTNSILEANKEASESIIKHYDPDAGDPTQQVWEYLDDCINEFLSNSMQDIIDQASIISAAWKVQGKTREEILKEFGDLLGQERAT